MKQAISKSTSKKGRKKRKKKGNINDVRKKHARGIRILQARKERGGMVGPRRNNRITESATKESREAKIKAKKVIQESNGKRQDEMTKTNEKGTRNNGTRRTTKEEKRYQVHGWKIDFASSSPPKGLFLVQKPNCSKRLLIPVLIAGVCTSRRGKNAELLVVISWSRKKRRHTP